MAVPAGPILGEKEVERVNKCFFCRLSLRIRQKTSSHCWCLVHVDRILKQVSVPLYKDSAWCFALCVGM